MKLRHMLFLPAASCGAALAIAPLAASGAGALAAPAPRALTCANKVVVAPVNFVISCADANAELTATRWKSWTASSAVGVTRFGLNLCNPNCASSRISFFPGSTARFSAPVRTKKHGELFSSLDITYKLKGKVKHFDMSWKGIPAFS